MRPGSEFKTVSADLSNEVLVLCGEGEGAETHCQDPPSEAGTAADGETKAQSQGKAGQGSNLQETGVPSEQGVASQYTILSPSGVTLLCRKG